MDDRKSNILSLEKLAKKKGSKAYKDIVSRAIFGALAKTTQDINEIIRVLQTVSEETGTPPGEIIKAGVISMYESDPALLLAIEHLLEIHNDNFNSLYLTIERECDNLVFADCYFNKSIDAAEQIEKEAGKSAYIYKILLDYISDAE